VCDQILTRIKLCVFTIVLTLAATCQLVHAANPTSGTLNPTAGSSVSWTGTEPGGASLDESTCADGVNCDVFTLNLTGSPTDYANLKLNIQIAWKVSTNDFDLYVHKGDLSGPVVGSSTNGAPSTAESVTIDPTTTGVGIYTVHVVDFSVAPGDNYQGTASINAPETPPPPAKGQAPTYSNYQSPSNMGNRAGEPSIGNNWNSGNVMFQAVLETLRVTFNTSVSPATATWQVKNGPNTSTTSLDPILFTDSKTGRTVVSQLLGTTSLSSFTDDDGDHYTPSQGSGIASGIDHQTVGGGPFRTCSPAQQSVDPIGCATLLSRGPLTAYANAVYYASQDVGLAEMALSRDGGLTYEAAHPMYTLADCGGLHGHIKVSASGIVYVPNKNCGGTQGLIVSKDNGLSFTVRHVTGSTPGRTDPSVGIGTKGRLYFGYIGRDGHPRIAVSDDQGQSWYNNQDVGAVFGLKNAVFPEVVAGDNDRAAFFFLGTTAAGDGTGADSGTPFDGVWHGYIATTYDGGKSWFTVDATPNDPVQLGVICTNGTTCPSGTRNLLDFNDITVGSDGRVYAAYADGCISAACIARGNDPNASHTRFDNDGKSKATIIRQSGGRGLLRNKDNSPLKP
jgi:hypothetical protein